MSRFAVIGSPVAQSKSPAMHRAAYAALGLPHTYLAREVETAELGDVARALRSGELDGVNVTAPHKRAVLEVVDEVEPLAARVGAANTLVRRPDGRVVASNTDVPALAHELRALGWGRPGGSSGDAALVLGTGGAARAAVVALAALAHVSPGLAPARIRVRARTLDVSCADLAALASPVPLSLERFDAPGEGPLPSLIIQATSAGMTGKDPGEAVACYAEFARAARDGRLVRALDLVYAPPLTPFLEAAKRAGFPFRNGFGMLVEQGALAFEAWLGIGAPREAMRAAAESAADRAAADAGGADAP